VLVKAGRFGPYVQLGEADEVEGKPRTASLLSTMSPTTLSMQDALRVLSLPRVVGTDPGTGQEIVATNGRYGPYLKRGSESRSLEDEEQLFSVGLEQALELFAQPKSRRGQRASAPLREFGVDPETGGTIVLKEGRFGPYVTDGETNASLRKGDTVEGLTPERAGELLAERRAAGPATRRGATSKAPAKRAPAGTTKAAPAGRAGTKRAPAGTTKAAAKKAAPGKSRQDGGGSQRASKRAGS
jgi:DNA topoisomerase-1